MQTRKLYYEDCHQSSFAATVTESEKCDKGWLVTLDATCFYPEGGGQACDTGVLGGVNVLDVHERGEEVVHLCDGPLTVGETVEGRIDYARRFDLMQQHTGEHIVSGIVNARYGFHNVGFHMGSELITIDFDGVIPAADLAQIELDANRAVWKNLPVKCWYPSEEELPSVGYRSKRELAWPVRVVEVPGVDRCACCGTHVAYTGEVGLIKLLSCVKFHQGVRIEMACAERALGWLNRAYEQNRLVSQAFSAKIMETGAAAQQMNKLLAEEKFRAAGLQKQMNALIAQSYVNCGNVAHYQPELDAGGVRELADAIAQVCGGVAAVFSGSDESGYNICLLGEAAQVKALGAAMSNALSARGGGKPGSFQGRAAAQRQQIGDFFATVWQRS